jgi:hypothetical protein
VKLKNAPKHLPTANGGKHKKKEKAFWKKNKKDDMGIGRQWTPEEREANALAYHLWFQAIEKEDLVMARVLCDVVERVERDQAANALVCYLFPRSLFVPLISQLIRKEVSKDEPGTLLRSNSMLTTLLSKHLHLVGHSYLRQILCPIISEVCQTATETNFEVNPTRLMGLANPAAKLDENVQNVLGVTKQILDSLSSSVNHCPRSIREICKQLTQVVSTKYPEAVTSVVGGYFFLRFVCPALLAPNSFSLVGEGYLTAPAKRGLILVSKVLQQLANGLPFGMKEDYMIKFNSFLEKHEKTVHDFLFALSSIGNDQLDWDEDPLEGNESEVKLCLGKLAFKNKESITQAFISGENAESITFRQVAEEWQNIRAHMLAPIES